MSTTQVRNRGPRAAAWLILALAPFSITSRADADPDLEQGRGALLAGQSRQALEAFQREERDAVARSDSRTRARALLGIGDAWTLRSAWQEALEAFEGAGTLDSELVPAARLRRIWVESQRIPAGADRGTIETRLEEALLEARTAGDTWIATRLVSRLVEMPRLAADPATSLASLDEALRDFSRKKAADVFGQASLLRPRGRALLDLGHPQEAEQALERALALLRPADAPGLTSRVLQDLGILHSRGGATAQALKMYQEAATYATELPRAYAACLRNIGVIYAKQGNYPLARQAMEEALRTSEKDQDRPGQVRALQNLGQLSAHFADLETARDYFSRSLPLVEEVLKPAEQASAWVNLGRLELEAGDLGRGEEAFRKALALAKELPGSSAILEARLGLGEAALLRGDLPAALQAGKEAAGSHQAEIFRRGKVLAAKAERALGRRDAALATLLGAVELTEDHMDRIAGGARDQELFLDDSFEVYGELIDLLAERGQIAEAFAWAERVKGRSLLRALSSPQSPRPRNPEQRTREAELVERLAALNQDRFRLPKDETRRSGAGKRAEGELARARLDLERFRSGLYAEQDGLRRIRADVVPFDPARPDEAWPPPGTVVLELVTLETKTLLFVLRPAEPSLEETNAARLRLVEIPIGWRELAGLTEQLRRRLADRSPAYAWPAERLYQLLIAPVEKDLAGARQLCVVPDGPLWDVPLQLLGTKGGKSLGERFTLYSAPSVSLLASLRSLRASRAEGSRGAPPGSLLAVGDPAFSKDATALVSGVRGFSPLTRLPDAAAEAKEVAAAYGGTVQVLIGKQARESRVKAEAGKFRTLHFATHALVDDQNPSFSTLVLAPDGDRKEDGLLETWEVTSLALDADLVVLAGCQTHRGRGRAARGLMGLSWAFAAAGSPAVVASHWDVDSKATRALMVGFHQRRQGGASTAEALRQAALAVRQQPEFRHPFYWAGFTLVGVPD